MRIALRLSRTTLTAAVAAIAISTLTAPSIHAQWIDRIAVGPSGTWMDGGDAKSAVGWGLSGVAVITPHIALQGEVHWFNDIEGEIVNLDSTPLALTVQLRKPSEGISYFVGAGVGYYMLESDVDLDRAFGPELSEVLQQNNFRAVSDVDDEIGFHVEIGTEIALLQNLTAQVAARYIWLEADVDVASDVLALPTPQGTALVYLDDESIDMSGAGMFISLRYSF